MTIRSCLTLASLLCLCCLQYSCAPKKEIPVHTPVTEFPLIAHVETEKPQIIAQTNSTELQVLIRLARGLEELETLIDEAQTNANPDSRIQFDYQQLRSDFFSIAQGIKSHVLIPNYLPRSLKPIAGQYGR